MRHPPPHASAPPQASAQCPANARRARRFSLDRWGESRPTQAKKRPDALKAREQKKAWEDTAFEAPARGHLLPFTLRQVFMYTGTYI